MFQTPKPSSLTLATAASCWKWESEDACKVIRSMGDPDGDQLISSSGYETRPSLCFCDVSPRQSGHRTYQLVGQDDEAWGILRKFWGERGYTPAYPLQSPR